MPRKSHRRRWRKKQDKPKIKTTTSHSKALEKQEELRQKSNYQHINKALEGRRCPAEEIIIERLRKNGKRHYRNTGG